MPLGILACWAACSFLGLSAATTATTTIEICLPFLGALPSLPADQVQDFIRWKIKSKVLSPEICGYIVYSELNFTRFLSGLYLPGQVPLLLSLLSSYQAVILRGKEIQVLGEGPQGSRVFSFVLLQVTILSTCNVVVWV